MRFVAGVLVVAGLGLMAAAAISALLPAGRAEAAIIQLSASLDEAQETTCASNSGATGSGSFTLDTSTGELSFNITFSGLSTPETKSHLHGPAPAGVGAPIVRDLPNGSPKVGSVTPNLNASEQDDVLNGLWYVNVHSDTCPGGEIRGQLIPQSVGGVARDAEFGTLPAQGTSASGGDAMLLVVLGAVAVGAGTMLVGAGWYARRRASASREV